MDTFDPLPGFTISSNDQKRSSKTKSVPESSRRTNTSLIYKIETTGLLTHPNSSCMTHSRFLGEKEVYSLYGDPVSMLSNSDSSRQILCLATCITAITLTTNTGC